MKLNTKAEHDKRVLCRFRKEFIKLYFEYSLRFKEREAQLELQIRNRQS